MKLPFLSRKDDASQPVDNSEAENLEPEQDREVDTGTKVKVVAALFVVAFATYVAYWVQEPTDVKVDVLGGTEESVADPGTMVMVAASGTMESGTEEMVTVNEAAQEVDVSIIDFTFSPASLSLEKGTAVVWTNKDTVPHTVTGPDFSSGTLNPGESYSHTFATDGTFDYSCSFHPQMKGQVMVGVAAEALPVTTEETEVTLTEETTLNPDLLTLQPSAPEQEPETLLPALEEPALSETELSPAVMTLDAQAILASQIAAQSAEDQVHAAAAEESARLAKSGPEDILYFAILGVILYFNRKKILGALR